MAGLENKEIIMQEITNGLRVQWNAIIVDILKAFIEICEKNSLQYYLAAGSAIGAVRHHGIIPWDDDIDVLMPRPDYELFLEVTDKMDMGKYEIVERKRTKYYHLPYAKMTNKNTTLLEVKSLKDITGLFIDIFPLDGTSDDRDVAKSLYNKYHSLANDLNEIETYYSFSDYYKFVKGFHIKHILKHIYKKIFISRDRLLKSMIVIEKKFPFDNANTVINYIEYWGFDKAIFPKKWFDVGVKESFENIRVNLPIEFDNYLKRMYGNYMQLPPVEKRETHHSIAYCNLEKRVSYDDVIKAILAKDS